MHKVTREWIRNYATQAGGWNAKQGACLGLKWAEMTHGWQHAAEGMLIEDAKAREFERLSGRAAPTVILPRTEKPNFLDEPESLSDDELNALLDDFADEWCEDRRSAKPQKPDVADLAEWLTDKGF